MNVNELYIVGEQYTYVFVCFAE